MRIQRGYNTGMVDLSTGDSIRIIDHTADWALWVRGRDLAELFTNAALGMAGLLVGDLQAVPVRVATSVARDIHLEAEDAEGLLVAWLGELAYWAERDGLVFHVFNLSEVTPVALSGTVLGGRVDELQKHIKAVTYHNLAVRRVADGYEVTVVFDV